MRLGPAGAVRFAAAGRRARARTTPVSGIRSFARTVSRIPASAAAGLHQGRRRTDASTTSWAIRPRKKNCGTTV
ncbi:hypothetical protein BJF79_20450 [Actinomadura sp. CNU-125]|nr:hypothetical protein BJF79_20450 [Actinomadura sp. CNU-125]